MQDSQFFKLLNQKKEIMSYLRHESIEDLLYEFLKARTPQTEEAYKRDLRDFFVFTTQEFALPRIANKQMRFEEIKRIHISKYKNHLENSLSLHGRPFAPNTINRKISAVASFFQFLLRREVIEKNPAEFCTRPNRITLYETQAFTDQEMKNLFTLVIDEAPALHKAVVLLLFTTGMRQKELRSLTLKNFSEHEGIRIIRYIGKGQKINQVPLHPTTGHFINKYIDWMKSIGREIGESDFLFQPTKNTYDGEIKKRLSHTAVSYIVKKWARRINPNKRITPHSARATFITSLIEGGEDIYYVSQIVNHADVRTTQRYNKRKRDFRKNPIFNLNFF